MSLVCINVTPIFFSRVVFFPAVFSAGQQTCLVAWTTSTPLDRFAVRLKKWLAKKLHDRQKCWLHLCKLEICTYISLAAIYGLTAITKILVAGWKHASFLCYSMGARWFLRFLGPKLELPSMSAYSPYLRCLWTDPTVSATAPWSLPGSGTAEKFEVRAVSTWEISLRWGLCLPGR